MTQQQIINYFRKVDHKFLTELKPSQRDEAIEQFQKIWVAELPKVSFYLHRRQKVISNRAEKELKQQHQTQQIASSLKSRMQKHFQKREKLQIQRLKNYKNLDKIWKDKMLQIRTQAKGERKKNLQRYKQISRQIQQFWKKKQSPSRSHSKSFSPKSENKNFNYFKSTNTKKQHNKQPQESFKFVTQVRMSKQRSKHMTSPRSETQLPHIRDPNKQRQQPNHTKQLKVKRASTQNFNYQALKSNQQWKVKQNSYFQSAMEKIDKILNIRIRVRQNLKGQIRKAKNNRLLKESMIKDKRYFSAAQVQHPSPHDLRHKNMEKRENAHRNSNASISDRQTQLQLRRKELNIQYQKNRQSMLLQQKEKQRKSKFHRMVRDAINAYRFQARRKKQ